MDSLIIIKVWSLTYSWTGKKKRKHCCSVKIIKLRKRDFKKKSSASHAQAIKAHVMHTVNKKILSKNFESIQLKEKTILCAKFVNIILQRYQTENQEVDRANFKTNRSYVYAGFFFTSLVASSHFCGVNNFGGGADDLSGVGSSNASVFWNEIINSRNPGIAYFNTADLLR